MNGERTVKTNNTEVCFATNEALHSFCIAAYIRAGSMYETAGNNGISHLYEHAVFRNLKRHYDGKLYELLSRHGLTVDADTYKEFMSFSVHGVTDGIDFGIDIISKLFLPLEIEQDEYDAEKQRIYCEINEDDEKGTLGWLHGRRCWDGAFPAGGISGRRSNIERNSLLLKYRNYAQQWQHMFLVSFCPRRLIGFLVNI